MKVRFVKWNNVVELYQSDHRMKNSFDRFYQVAKLSTWTKPQDVFETFNNTDIVTCTPYSRIVFNIGPNKYRLICGYFFGKNRAVFYVKFAGIHEDYDQVNVCQVDQFKTKLS